MVSLFKGNIGTSAGIVALLALQGLCAEFLVSDILIALLGLPLPPIGWQFYELIELGAVLGLILGFFLGVVVLRRVLRQSAMMQEKLRIASGALMELVHEKFGEWNLTKAERDVALFLIKGMSTAEIAQLRNTSEGTVKAQTNAIYKKAEVSGRAQLLSQFLEDLYDEALLRDIDERGR